MAIVGFSDRPPADPAENALKTEQSRQQEARAFLARAQALVDVTLRPELAGAGSCLEQQAREDAAHQRLLEQLRGVSQERALPAEPTARFRREPDIFLRPVRFGRVQLWLARIFGPRVWRLWRAWCGQ